MLLFCLLSFQAFSLETKLDAKKSEIRWKGSKITGSHHFGKDLNHTVSMILSPEKENLSML